MHGKTQNANESFDGTIWEHIPKTTFVTLPNLEFGVCDGVVQCNIRMKAPVFIYEKLKLTGAGITKQFPRFGHVVQLLSSFFWYQYQKCHPKFWIIFLSKVCCYLKVSNPL